MKLETLEKGIAINENIGVVGTQRAILRKLYSKKEELSYADIEKLFAIASSSIDQLEVKFKEELEKL